MHVCTSTNARAIDRIAATSFTFFFFFFFFFFYDQSSIIVGMCLWLVLDVVLAKLVSVVAIFALAGETFPGVFHSLDVWHKAKILGKTLSE